MSVLKARCESCTTYLDQLSSKVEQAVNDLIHIFSEKGTTVKKDKDKDKDKGKDTDGQGDGQTTACGCSLKLVINWQIFRNNLINIT